MVGVHQHCLFTQPAVTLHISVQHGQSTSYLHKQRYFVEVVGNPLASGYLLQGSVLLVGQQGERPAIWRLLHHVVGIDRLHVGISCQLQSICVVQFLQ